MIAVKVEKVSEIKSEPKYPVLARWDITNEFYLFTSRFDAIRLFTLDSKNDVGSKAVGVDIANNRWIILAPTETIVLKNT